MPLFSHQTAEVVKQAQALWNRQPVQRGYNRTKKYGQKIVWAAIRSLFILGFCFVILYPVISMISKAFMHQSDIYDNTVIWIPKHFTLDNLKYAWTSMNYPKSLLLSFLMSLSITVLQTFSCMMAGYAFARFEFPLKKLAFILVVFTIMIPPQQTMIPLYLHFKSFDVFGILSLLGITPPNLLDSFTPFLLMAATCMGIRNGLFIFIFRQYFRSVPWETEESAMVDGASALRIFLSIMLPNAVTIIATVFLFSFVWEWNDTFYTGMLLQKTETLTKAFEYYNMLITSTNVTVSGSFNTTDPNVVSMLQNAGIFLVMVPLIAIYSFTQRYFVEGIERTGIVG